MRIIKRCVMIVLSILFLVGSYDTSVFAEKILIGDYISLGKYSEQEIVWRYVADDENGMLMFCDTVLCEKVFDEVKSGDNRNFSERYGICAGTSCWAESSIRAWLNSEENECGFLSSNNFTSVDKSMIKTVSLNTGLDPQYYGLKDGGNNVEQKELTIYYSCNLDDTIIGLYEKQSYKTTNDRIFLIDIIQLSKISNNADILFNSKDEFKNEFEITALRSAYGGFDYYDMGAQDSGYYIHTMYMMPNSSFYEESGDYNGNFKISYTPCFLQSKIRPAFYLNEENAQILSGSGTKEDPYVLDGKPVPERFEENGLYGYKDAGGNVIVPAKYLKAWEFSEGAALVVLPEDPYRLRYIDTTGNYIFDKAFYASNNFNDGYALVLVADDPKYTYIDKTGELATELLFDDAEDFCGGYARVQIDGKWGVVDTNFSFKVPCEYDNKDEVLGKLDLS